MCVCSDDKEIVDGIKDKDHVEDSTGDDADDDVNISQSYEIERQARIAKNKAVLQTIMNMVCLYNCTLSLHNTIIMQPSSSESIGSVGKADGKVLIIVRYTPVVACAHMCI